MDEKDFKKHLRDLAHGKHNPAEHDWAADPTPRKTATKSSARPAKATKRRAK